ncbi:MAG: hypothetical protein R6X12_07995, partial [bacterium]
CLPWLWRTRFLATERALPVRAEFYRLLPGSPSPRLLDLPGHASTVDDFPRLAVYPALGYLFGGIATPLGPPYHQFAPRSMAYLYPWFAAAAADLGDQSGQELAPGTLKALALAGITHVLTPATEVGEGLVRTRPGLDWDDRYLRAGRRPPLVFAATGYGIALGSRVLRPVTRPGVDSALTVCYAGDWRELLDAVEVDRDAAVVSSIPVEGEPHDSLPGDSPLLVRDWRVKHERVEVDLENAEACWVRLALSWYPCLDVRLDGEQVMARPTADGFTYFFCPAGGHSVSVTARTSAPRNWLVPVSALALVACAWLAIPGRVSGRKKRGA